MTKGRYDPKVIFLLGAAIVTLFLFSDSWVATAMGMVSFDQINTEVFIPQGYEIVSKSRPIPHLKFRREPSCEQINLNCLKIAEESPTDPPKVIPFALLSTYTMNNYSLFDQWLFFHAMKYVGLSGLIGSVIDSQTPWVDVLALQNGAKKVLTVEYQTTTITGTDKVKYIHPLNFVRMWKEYQGKLDFVVSFSSIEHSGLQRYGDPMDPNGDLREVLKVRCTLKENGLFFLVLPRGQDHLVYNIHRIYGRIRLAMVFAGFELVHVFRNDDPLPANLGVEHFDGKTSASVVEQDLFVLRKISSPLV